MDVKGSLCVVGTAAKKLHVFDMNNPFNEFKVCLFVCLLFVCLFVFVLLFSSFPHPFSTTHTPTLSIYINFIIYIPIILLFIFQ